MRLITKIIEVTPASAPDWFRWYWLQWKATKTPENRYRVDFLEKNIGDGKHKKNIEVSYDVCGADPTMLWTIKNGTNLIRLKRAITFSVPLKRVFDPSPFYGHPR